ncbi:MAG: hypothetical protein M0D55_05630 [Elusimicrobiota bacterium]|nr:MAG: hypothetical protein M0D55_05630 [Elusimicrobiota bacterium]
MVRALSAAILLLPAAAYANPAVPSFEGALGEIRAAVAATRAAQVKAKAGDIGPRLSTLAWDLDRAERDAYRLRNDLRWLLQRARRYQKPQPGRPETDPSLRWDVQRFTRDLAQTTRDAQWRLGDLRHLSAQAEKDETLVGPASRVVDAARRLKNESNWLVMDARFGYWDLMRAGFTFEGMDLDRNSRDLDDHARDLQSEGDKLLAKVRGS